MRRYLAGLALGTAALTILGACTPIPTPAAPTVGAAATAAATAAQPAAMTAVAAASPVATQVVAVASPAAATAAAASPIQITDARLDPSDATISIQNLSSAAVDLTGWRVRVGSATAALPSGARVGPGEPVTLHTASGTNTARDIYLGPEASTLLQGFLPGAPIELVDPQGSTVATFSVPS